MNFVTNRFGSEYIDSIDDVTGVIYCVCTACLSVWTDFLSWANANPERMMLDPQQADIIIILGCQVTDLAVLNDLRTAERLHAQYPTAKIYMSGCLAQRFDIELPQWMYRLDVTRIPYQPLDDLTLIDYQSPFWAKEGNDKAGSLFKPGTNYPLKIGAGCQGKCKYCTIRDTRGETFETCSEAQLDEFCCHENVLLIADSINADQLKDWCEIAIDNDKPVSIRNLEPGVANACWEHIVALAESDLLPVLHVPIQSCVASTLERMGRDADATRDFVLHVDVLRKTAANTKFATNIIVDYEHGVDTMCNCSCIDERWLHNYFDYFTWNPYWDGVWSREKAEERWQVYIEDEKYPL